jgi:hypothetical protein
MRRLVLACLFGSIALACGGAIAPDETNDGATGQMAGQGDKPSAPPQVDPGTTTPPSSSVAPPPAEEEPIDDPIPTGIALPTGGTCAAYTPAAILPIGGGGPLKCQVATPIKDPNTGAAVGVQRITNGDRGDTELKDGTLLLRCATAEKVIFQAAIHCFDDTGTYSLAPGELVLGGQLSDRQCSLRVEVHSSEVRGFIGCGFSSNPNETNVFAATGPPLGLGAFSLPRTF